MIMNDDDFYRFMFWYCGDSVDTIKIALDTWRNYMQDDEEQTKSYNDFHAIQTKDINKD